MKFSGVKKISAAAIAAMMLVAGMTACGSSDSTGTADSGATTGTDVKKIGIIQLVEHDSLDSTAPPGWDRSAMKRRLCWIGSGSRRRS